MPWLHTIAGVGGFPPRTHIGCRSAGEKAFQTLQMNTNEASVYIQHKAEETRGNLNEAFLFLLPLSEELQLVKVVSFVICLLNMKLTAKMILR